MNSNALKLVLVTAAVCITAATASPAQEAEATAVEVTGTAPGSLRQDSPVGPYNQPEWTTQPSHADIDQEDGELRI